MVTNGLGFTLLISKPANNMSYNGKALVARPIADEITPLHVILRQPEQAAANPHVEVFAKHC